MKSRLVMVRGDGAEAALHLAMGVAVALMLGVLFQSMIRTSDQSPQIARALERWEVESTNSLVAGSSNRTDGAVVGPAAAMRPAIHALPQPAP